MTDVARRILVINGKGGCGKTTVATNLAATYASMTRPTDGESDAHPFRVALMDHDPQASSTYWNELRSDELPQIHLIKTHERASMYQTKTYAFRMPPDTDRVIVDGHSNARDRDLEALIKQADIILVPILASPIDIRAGGRFITELLTHRLFRASPKPVGVIANRVRPNTETHEKFMHFLECLDVPNVATFRDSPAYHDAVEQGMGIVDMKECRAARKEHASWVGLVKWIEAQPHSERGIMQSLRTQPLPANRRTTDSGGAAASA